MGHVNKGFLSGRVYNPRFSDYNGTRVANFTLRQYKRFKKDSGEYEEKVDFFPLEAWGSSAEYIEKVFKKGLFASVEYTLGVKKEKDTGHSILFAKVLSFDPQPAPRDESAGAPSDDADAADDADEAEF